MEVQRQNWDRAKALKFGGRLSPEFANTDIEVYFSQQSELSVSGPDSSSIFQTHPVLRLVGRFQ